MNHDRRSEGRQPWDPANGLRVGVMIGALIGAALFLVSGRSTVWLIVVSAAVGGGIGFWSEKRRQPKR